MMRKFSFSLFVLMTVGLIACSPMVKLAKAQTSLLQDTALKGAHLGVAVFDPASSKYLYNYQGDHYFVPASNTKLFTCYAAMKYLGDSLVGARYQNFSDTVINVFATGDPTFLHPDFSNQPVLSFFQKNLGKKIALSTNWKGNSFGKGWAWDDYNDYYMAERSPFPVSGNVTRVDLKAIRYGYLNNSPEYAEASFNVKPAYFTAAIENVFRLPLMYSVRKTIDSTGKKKMLRQFFVHRDWKKNSFILDWDSTLKGWEPAEIPFVTDGLNTSINILRNDYKIAIQEGILTGNSLYGEIPPHLIIHTIHSQPTDSLLRPMMYRSDNFFAEQSLLMVSNEKLGYMNDEAIIDTLLQNDLKDLPQKPVWVDGSGLSRYNLITPQDFVTVLLKMKNEFGIERIKNILPKGNTGTLTNYYQKLGANIFAKTGTLSGVVALSGYLTCKSGKLLLFSVIVNNHNSSGRAVRRAVEKFVIEVWEKN